MGTLTQKEHGFLSSTRFTVRQCHCRGDNQGPDPRRQRTYKKNVTEKTQRPSRLVLPASVFPSPFRLNLSHLVPLEMAEHFRSPRRWEITLQNLKTCERVVFLFRNTSKHLLFSCHYLNNNLTEKDVEEEYCCRFTYNPATSKGIRKHKPLRESNDIPNCVYTTPHRTSTRARSSPF